MQQAIGSSRQASSTALFYFSTFARARPPFLSVCPFLPAETSLAELYVNFRMPKVARESSLWFKGYHNASNLDCRTVLQMVHSEC